MIRLFLIIFTLLHFIATGAFSGTVDDAQRMLNQLGYNAGAVDGAYGGKTKRALEAFYSDKGSKFDGALDANEIADLSNAISQAGISMAPKTGVEIESAYAQDPNETLYLIQLPLPGAIKDRYWWAWTPTFADFNNDGVLDIFITGTKPSFNSVPEGYIAKNTGDSCGPAKKGCPGPNAPPSLFIGNGDGTYNLRDDLIVDKRENPGQDLARQQLVADYNGDGTLDVYIADTGIGQHRGYRDSYYLSQPDGTWFESSKSHLSKPGYVTYNHGAATGDIDGDGDMDVIINATVDGMKCLVNDGSGYLRQRNCGNIHGFAMELVDWDGDGDLDIAHHSGLHPWKGNWKKGISFNNGRGSFTYRSIALKQSYMGTNRVLWDNAADISAWDLDGDGDQDLVNSVVQGAYGGVALEITENLGNGKHRTEIYELLVPPVGFVSKGEGREAGNHWNKFIEQMIFTDLDGDSDTDIMLVNKGSDHLPDEQGINVNLPNGSWMRNDGDMNFKFMYGPEGSNIKFVDTLDILVEGKEVKIPHPTDAVKLKQAIAGVADHSTSMRVLCENATKNNQWDMDNEYWIYHAQQRGMNLQFCLDWLKK